MSNINKICEHIEALPNPIWLSTYQGADSSRGAPFDGADLKALVAELRRLQSPWVPVETALPESDDWYLAMLDFGKKGKQGAICRFTIGVDGKGWWVVSGSAVVAWMPIPPHTNN